MEKEPSATSGNNVPANAREASARNAQVFKFKSPAFDRSKYLALHTIQELRDQENSTSFMEIYANSALSYWGLMAGLKRWLRFNYIYSLDNDGKKTYRLAPKGKRFLAKLNKIFPNIVDQWLTELSAWRRLLPADLDWRRSALVRILEPMRVHRPATHPGKRTGGGVAWWSRDKQYVWFVRGSKYSKLEIMTPEQFLKTKQEGGEWIFFTYGDHAAVVLAGGQTKDGRKLKKPISRKRALRLVESTDYSRSRSVGSAAGPDPR
jgi:hypothetical protein